MIKKTVRLIQKTVEAEAFKVTLSYCRGEQELPFNKVIVKKGFEYLLVETRKGSIIAHLGDWIVKNTDGEVFPVSEAHLYDDYYILSSF